jgi:hypothetical protein
VTAIVAALSLMAERNADGDTYNHFFDKYSQADLTTLQEWVDAVNEAKKAEEALAADMNNQGLADAFIASQEKMEEAFTKANAIDGLISAYNAWRSGQAGNQADDLYLDVPLKVADGAESDIQSEVDGYDIESVVKMLADTSDLQSAVNATNLSAYVNLKPYGTPTTGTQVDGSHAGGLDEVPFDGYIARLHKGEAVLNSTNAEAWRSGGMNTGRLEGMMAQLISLTQQLVSSSGRQVVLDSGVLVGQLAPALDTQLGTISSRKGRRN